MFTDSEDIAQENSIDQRWSGVKTYSDLLKLNVEYVLGILKCSPFHSTPFPPLDSFTKERLVQLYRHGLYVTDMQIPKHSFKRLSSDDAKAENIWIEEEERGLLEFYINLEDNAKLAQSFYQELKTTNLYYACHNPLTRKTSTNIFCSELNEIAIPLRRWKQSNTLQGEYTNLWYLEKLFAPNSYNATSKTILDKCAHFVVMLPNFYRYNLEEFILAICKNTNGKIYELGTFQVEE